MVGCSFLEGRGWNGWQEEEVLDNGLLGVEPSPLTTLEDWGRAWNYYTSLSVPRYLDLANALAVEAK